MTISGAIVEYDAEATREAYAKVPGGINTCKCEYCANYRLVREQVYPPEFRDLLEQLGIDYRKEVELDHLADDETGDGPEYGQSVWGHFGFAGRILQDDTLLHDTSRFGYCVVDGAQVHPVICAMFGSPPFIELEFWVPYVPQAGA